MCGCFHACKAHGGQLATHAACSCDALFNRHGGCELKQADLHTSLLPAVSCVLSCQAHVCGLMCKMHLVATLVACKARAQHFKALASFTLLSCQADVWGLMSKMRALGAPAWGYLSSNRSPSLEDCRRAHGSSASSSCVAAAMAAASAAAQTGSIQP